MKLKFIITIFLAIILSEFSIANFYEKGDTLHVWATSGLNMREGPGTDFPKMKKLEYGDKVQAIDDYLRSTPLNITVVKKSKNSDAFVIKGHWVRVIIGTQEGYVFDGYLSRLPVLKIMKTTEEGVPSWQSEDLEQYVSREIGFKERKTDTLEYGSIIYSYKARKWFSYSSESNECFDAITEFSDMTFHEVYLFMNILYRFENIQKLQKVNPERTNWEIRKVEKVNGKTIFIFGEDLWEGDLYEGNGKIIFSEGACC